MLGNWIKQTTTSTGTGNLTLAAVTGFPTFANQFAVGEFFYYTVLNDADGTPVESGIGRLSDATTLVRDKVLATFVGGTYNDNDPTAATIAAGTKRVICSAEQGAVVTPPHNLAGTNRVIYAAGQIVPNTSTNSAALLNRPYYIPVMISTPRTIDAVMCRIAIAGTTGSVGKGALYAATLAGAPGTKIVESATVATDTTGLKVFSLTKRRYKPGLYYIGIVFDVAAPNFTNPAPVGMVAPLNNDPGTMLVGTAAQYEVSTGTVFPATAAPVAVRGIDETPLVALRLA